MEEARIALKQAMDEFHEKSCETLWVQRHELIELKEEIYQRRLELEQAQREVEGQLEERGSHCIRCGEEFSECCEEDCENESLCEWCGHICHKAALEG